MSGQAVHCEVKLALCDGSIPGQSLGHCRGGGGQRCLLAGPTNTQHMALKAHIDGQKLPDNLEGLVVSS